MTILPRLASVPVILAVSACTLVGYPTGLEDPPAPVGQPVAEAGPQPGPPAGPAEEIGEPEARRDPPDFRRDGPPPSPPDVDLDTISDAVPREEPRSRYGNPAEYEVEGQTFRTLESADGYEEEGVASWYGGGAQGRRTSSGEPYDPFAMTTAHRTLPLPSYLEITNLENGRRVVVRVNDRGPFHGGRLIDVSYAAAHRLGMVGTGTARVRVRALHPGG